MIPKDVDAVVCTMNSASSIEQCLLSLRAGGIGRIIVVDAHSTDGTRHIADRIADVVIEDLGVGLGHARNLGIQQTKAPLILNMGSDNVLPPGQIERMIATLDELGLSGVSARTVVQGNSYLARSLNAWRMGRFPPGLTTVIGTPTLFRGELLRAEPFDSTTRFSDDSELCERWQHKFGARFGISPAFVYEIGKATWQEVVVRARMYGMSDHEIFSRGRVHWGAKRRLRSASHPIRVDLLEPLMRLPGGSAITAAPFLATFTGMRYFFWLEQVFRHNNQPTDNNA